MKKWCFDWNYWNRKIDNYYPAKNTPRVDSKFERPDWDTYFMGLAIMASKRSADPTTQHGSVIVAKDNRIISTGYNSYLAGLDHEDLPNCRYDPDFPNSQQANKYRWIQHSEDNAIDNSMIDLRTTPDTRIYITGRPCLNCAQRLIRSKITHWIMLERGDRWGCQSLESDPYGDAQDWLWLTLQRDVQMEWMLYDQKDFQWVKEAFNL